MGSLPVDAVEKRLARCFSESEPASAELVARWVPMEFFTEDVSDEVASAMAAIVSDFHPRGFRLMARSLAENDTTSLLPTIRVPTLLLWVTRINALRSMSPTIPRRHPSGGAPDHARRRTREQHGAARRVHRSRSPVLMARK